MIRGTCTSESPYGRSSHRSLAARQPLAILTAHGHAYEQAAADYVGFRVFDDGAKEYPEDCVGDEEVI